MNKTATLAAAAAFSTLALTGANAQETSNTADLCVLDQFNAIAQVLADLPKGVSIKLGFTTDDLIYITEQCENETGQEAEFFQGLEKYSTTIGAITLEFK